MSTSLKGGFAVTDSDSSRPLSPSRLGTYTRCPRQYEYKHDLSVETSDQTRRYLDRGLALHGTIEYVCETIAGESDEEIRALALDAFADEWDSRTSRTEYATAAHYEYDKQLARAAIEAYFSTGPGLDHVRGSVLTEVELECERDGISLHGYADNVVRTDDGLQIIDYKPSVRYELSTSDRAKEKLREHLAGEDYHPRIVKSAIQAATYIEGIQNTTVYEPGMEVVFTYYGLLANTNLEKSTAGVQPRVSGYGRDVEETYYSEEETIWGLIQRAHDGIREDNYEPIRWDSIRENACDRCDYRSMCTDALAEEVQF